MSARVSLISVEPTQTKNKLTEPIHLKIAFEAYEDLPEEIEFETVIAWDGDREHDQVLDSIEVGPVKAGKHQFVLDAVKLPNYSLVKDEDITDVCVLFLHCSYRGNRFACVSFYVSHDYTDPELIKEPPEKPVLDKLERNISVEDFRVTTFPIKWTDADEIVPTVEEPIKENGDSTDMPIAV